MIGLVWLEYNIHIRPEFRYAYPKKIITILLDLIKPFVETHKDEINHWHYLIEGDKCRGKEFAEIRFRVEARQAKLKEIKKQLSREVRKFSKEKHLTIPEGEDHGSHEGENGERDKTYKGAQSEKRWGQDWDKIVEILQIGSESSLKILYYYPSLRSSESHKGYQIIRVIDPRTRIITNHPYFLHLPANQFLVEP